MINTIEECIKQAIEGIVLAQPDDDKGIPMIVPVFSGTTEQIDKALESKKNPAGYVVVIVKGGNSVASNNVSLLMEFDIEIRILGQYKYGQEKTFPRLSSLQMQIIKYINDHQFLAPEGLPNAFIQFKNFVNNSEAGQQNIKIHQGVKVPIRNQ